MQKTAKILALPPQKSGRRDILDALAEHNISKWGTSGVGIPPKRLPSGKYATGLDENADYIKLMAFNGDQEGALREAEIVRARRLRLEKATGYDLSPNSEYYSGCYGARFDQPGVARKIKLRAKNVFNFDNADEEITFWWASQHNQLIAPSLEEYKSGDCPSTVEYYIENPEKEAAILYKEALNKTDAIEKLKNMEESRLRKTLKLCGVPISDTDLYQTVFTLGYKMLDKDKLEGGKYKGQAAITIFNRIAGLTDKVLNVQTLVKDALILRVYSERNNVIYEGDMIVAPTEEALVTELCKEENAIQYQSLDIKVADKRKLKSLASASLDLSSLPDVLPAEVPGQQFARASNEDENFQKPVDNSDLNKFEDKKDRINAGREKARELKENK